MQMKQQTQQISAGEMQQEDTPEIYMRKNKSRSSNSSRNSFARQQIIFLQFLELEMGLNEEQAALIINAHNFQNVAEIPNLFIKDDVMNTYSHLFCPNEQQLCIICSEGVSSHNYVSNTAFKNILTKIKKTTLHQQFKQEGDYFQINQKQNVICNICYGNFANTDIVKFKSQNHKICEECFRTFLNEQISIARVLELKCPHCSVELSAEIIEEHVDARTFKKYKMFLRNRLIQNDPTLRWCPNPKCEKIIKIDNRNNKTQACKCGTVVCLRCNREDHPNKTCDEVFKNEIKEWSDAIDLQKCKKCKSLVQKISGCNHMTCGVCRYEWCWLCSASYSPIHFSPFNPFGCPGLQNGNHLSRDWGYCKRTLYRIGIFTAILILIPIILPIFLFLIGPIFLIIRLKESNCFYYKGVCVRLLLFFISALLGIILDPIIWIGLFFYYIPPMIREYIRYYQENRRRQQQQIPNIIDQFNNTSEEINNNIQVRLITQIPVQQ